MDTVKVELPAELVKAAQLEPKNVSQDAARLLALELYREGKVSLGRAAELCETPLAAFLDFAADHSVTPLQFSPADLEHEHEDSNRIDA